MSAVTHLRDIHIRVTGIGTRIVPHGLPLLHFIEHRCGLHKM